MAIGGVVPSIGVIDDHVQRVASEFTTCAEALNRLAQALGSRIESCHIDPDLWFCRGSGRSAHADARARPLGTAIIP